MLSKILLAGLYALAVCRTVSAAASQAPIVAGSPAVLQTGHYEIRNKAYDGQLAAFYRNDLIVVLNNATIPKSPDQGKWKITEVTPTMYSISNVGLGVGLFPNVGDGPYSRLLSLVADISGSG
ncbi:hypothetical protein C8R47DRAFT_420390 [Mycena vitilis]|nr:hypothetical protein C8R47DRAFT_420390 [Mycena vitilis]